jgi:serine/threonine-protein kinase
VLPAASIEPAQAAPASVESKPATQAAARTPEPTQDGSAWPVAAPAIQLPPPPPAAKKGPTALVLLAISPWGEVFVDGKSMGVSPPLTELELPQGKHRIVVRNSEFKPFDEEIDLGSNQTLRIKHKFARGS